MSIQYINTGSSANAGNGDSLRSAFIKVNNNFAYLSTSSFGGGSGNGYTGSRGNAGYTGSAGSQGNVGYTGSAGSQGNVGYTGSAGTPKVNFEDPVLSNVGSLAVYQSTSTIGHVPWLKIEQGMLTIRDTDLQNPYSGLYIQNNISSENFGRGFTFATHHNVAEGNNFTFYRTRGTSTAPTPLTIGDEVVDIAFLGHNGIIPTYGFSITATVDQVPVNGQQPMRLTFVGNNNAGQSVPHLSISSTGTIRMNSISALGAATQISVSASLIPKYNRTYDLGSTSSQWRSLYVSSSTIYIDGKALSIDANNNITINGNIATGGYTGSQGDRGFTGSRGDAGSTGEAGATGFTGSRGNLGFTGSRGDTGYDGSRGDIGYTGSEGTPGQQGNRGYTGSEGAQGTPGLQGLTGAQGVSIVLVGSTDTVTTSTVGLGNAGQGWINTTDGDVYFWNTLTTNWENIGPIVGPQGDLGYTGSRGSQGDIGLTGDLGYTGSQGDKGYDGSRGDVGYAGSQGELGYVGSQGDIGYVGSRGNVGFTGSAGADGTVGFTGSAGADGTVGFTGSAGADGAPGPDLYTPETPVDWTGTLTVATFSQGLDELASRTVTLEGSKDRITSGSYSVILGSDGVLTFPNGDLTIGYNGASNVIEASSDTLFTVLGSGPGGAVGFQWISDTTTSTTNAAAVILNSPFSASSGTVQIVTGAVTGPTAENTWEFGADGTLTAPGHLMPNADLAYDLGSTTTQWRSIYVGTGTIFIGGVALGVNENNYVTVDGNPIITVNTSGNMTIQGDTNIVLGSVVISDTAPAATTPGSQWFNTLEARTYVAYNEQWVDSSPTVLAPPDTNPTLESVTFNDATVQTTAWSGSVSYNDLTDKPATPTFVGGGGASTWLTAD